MNPADIHRAAELLSRSRLDGSTIDELPDSCRPVNETEAYLIQDDLHECLRRTKFGRVAGHKIGCTTSVMQDFLNIRNPCAGGVFASTAQNVEGIFEHEGYRHVGVECEIAVRLGAPLDSGGGFYNANSVAGAVAQVMPAIEIVDDRYDDYVSLGVPTLIADDFFDAGCVLGDPVGDWRALDLVSVAGYMRINGIEVGRGRGGDIMGHPFTALAWLANLFVQRGKVLAPGEFILLGSVVETKWVQMGDKVEIDIEGLGRAQAQFP